MLQSKAYRSKKAISTLPKAVIEKEFYEFLNKYKKIYSRHLGRSIHLDKLPEAITKRRDSFKRLQCFQPAIDILRRSKKWTTKNIDGYKCIEINGLSQDGQTVKIHLREESLKGDKKLFLISFFHKEKTSFS